MSTPASRTGMLSVTGGAILVMRESFPPGWWQASVRTGPLPWGPGPVFALVTETAGQRTCRCHGAGADVVEQNVAVVENPAADPDVGGAATVEPVLAEGLHGGPQQLGRLSRF